MASSSSSNSAHASSSRVWKYDVFLSFRGEDTRKTFVDHLHSALVQRLIRVYKDDEALPRGDSIGPSIFKAIEESHIVVIVFSKNYAGSSWCLDELSYIMKCRVRGLTVMPIFYDVDPSQIRKQEGCFGKAFAKQEAQNITKAELWRKALFDANSGVDEDLPGLRVRVLELISPLELGSDCVRMCGIWGIGGSGKATLAFSVYKEISRSFQGHCFIANIREQSKYGLENLQQKILLTVLKTDQKVQSVEEGKYILKSRLCNSKVLVVLDDVDNQSQLEALVGSHEWFGAGSRIIITTRDEHVLTSHRVDDTSSVRLLSDQEAIQLFNKHAYNEVEPLTNYEKHSLSVVSYAAGLPLAVKVLGSFLYDKDESEWISALSKLKVLPNIQVMDILRISYDGLEPLEKELFLDIACFFRWESADITDEPMEILDACGFHPVIGIKVLQEIALITTVGGKFDMHDLVQEMGHYIVREKHYNNPEKHTRVWRKEDISNMCLGDATKQNNKIEVIDTYSYLPRASKIISTMKKLRWLSVYHGCDDEGPSFLSNELRYFSWRYYPESPFPDSFQPTNLVILKLDCSLQSKLWNGYKRLPYLKVLRLRNMKSLVNTPDFSGLPCLQKLALDSCKKLKEIHQSLGNHRSLEDIRVVRCEKLRTFPTILQMEKLNTLMLKYCNILEFPKIQGKMHSLEMLYFSGNKIALESMIHQSIRKLHLSSLRKLHLGGWGLKDGKTPYAIGELSNLEELDLRRNDFSTLGFSLLNLTRLKILILSECNWLEELPELPSSIAIIEADNCTSLTTTGNHHRNLNSLCQVSLVEGGIVSDAGRFLQSMLQGRAFDNHCTILRFEGVEIPKRFNPGLVRGNRCTYQLPENWYNDFSGFLMCAALPYVMNYIEITMKCVMVSGLDSQDDDDMAWEAGVGTDKRTWVGYVLFGLLKHTLWWDETSTALSFSFDHCTIDCSGIGIKLVPKKIGIAPAETSTNYPPHFKILLDSALTLKISLEMITYVKY
uniref:disease resistance protein RUN1-like n=1 Tax=Erigeron canadensis TaxID=72917 RepID=UPI001CB95396|nr:disease resistance protein RUN1-like [Erigeron canadensis]